MDQNEKLVMYGVTHVCARDEYLGKVVEFITMPVKSIMLSIFSGIILAT